MTATPNRVCAYCGTAFYIKPYRLHRKWATCGNIECRTKARSEFNSRPRSGRASPSDGTRAKQRVSMLKRWEDPLYRAKHTITRNCERCGAEMTIWKNPHRFCSKECRAAAWKEFANTPGWRQHLSRVNKGHPVSVAARSKMSVAKKGKPAPARSIATKKKLSKSLQAYYSDPDRREALIKRASNQPRRLTSIELKLQIAFETAGLTFVMHQHMLRFYEVDFLFTEANLIVEADGDYWHSTASAVEKDARRDAAFAAAGYQVVRFWGSDIKKDAAACAAKVALLLTR